MDLITFLIFFSVGFLISVVYKNFATIAVVSASNIYVGFLTFTEGVICNPSFLCTSQMTIYTAGSTFALLFSVIVVFGSIINMYASVSESIYGTEKERNGRK